MADETQNQQEREAPQHHEQPHMDWSINIRYVYDGTRPEPVIQIVTNPQDVLYDKATVIGVLQMCLLNIMALELPPRGHIIQPPPGLKLDGPKGGK